MENILIKRAQLTPKKVGLIYGEQRWSYEDMLSEAQTILNQIVARLGNIPERVAVLGANKPSLYMTLLGLLLGNCETVILNNRLTAKEIEEQLEIAKPAVYLYDEELEVIPQISNQIQGIAFSELVISNEMIDLDMVRLSHVSEDTVQTIMFTSGTTGVPKGVQQTVKNHLASAMGSALNLGMTPDDRWLLTVPLYHISGYSMLMKGLIYGNSIVLLDKFKPDKVAESMKAHGVTHLSLVPTMLSRLLNEPDFLSFGSQLKAILLGGAPVDQEILLSCHKHGLPIIQSFGMTETASQVIALNHVDSLRKVGSSGQPLLPVSLKIADATTPFSIGEILISGPNVTPGYINSEIELTDEGYFRTGDLGYLDDEGFLFVIGRQKEMFISGGENIYPFEVEQVLIRHTGINEVAVTSEKDAVWGERVVAYIQGDTTLNMSELNELLTNLSRYKHPKHYYVIPNMPKNSLGKIQKKDLEKQPKLKKFKC